MAMTTKPIEYIAQGMRMQGFVCRDENIIAESPIVMIAPTWEGVAGFAKDKAEQIAQLGYIAFAIDFYGNGKTSTDREECSALMAALKANRQLLQQRMLAAYECAKSLTHSDRKQIAAIGFCFGGMAVLDLARSGVGIDGVISFHGMLDAPAELPAQKINTRILVLHGHEDPYAPVAAIDQFKEEMQRSQADWQLHVFGNTMHSFTNPKANKPELGSLYNELSHRRSWNYMLQFFDEIFSTPQ